MKLSSDAIEILRILVHDLVLGHFDELEADGRAGRLTADDLRYSVTKYGRTLIDVPDSALETADVYALKTDKTTCAVDLDLWTIEEGRSDLTLSVTIQSTSDGVSVTIDDLHVL